jgi:hypothetical protein
MKQVHDSPLPTRNLSKDEKVNEASFTFFDLFRRIAGDSQKEKLANG